MENEKLEHLLSGGHPNSLGRTIDVVDIVLPKPENLEELYNCYFSTDETVRLRTSNAIKRISKNRPDWLIPYVDRFIATVANIDQSSVQWTLASLFETLSQSMTNEQITSAKKILKRNLEIHDDWIILNTTMQTLSYWSNSDSKLKEWLIPHLDRLSADKRKSVSGRAKKLLAKLG